MPDAKKIVTPLLLVFLTGLIVRLPLYTSPFWREPDVAEYLNIAHNLLSGQGYTQSLKMSFFDNSPVVIPAYTNRLPVTPVFFFSLLLIRNNFYWLQLCLLVLGAADVCLFYLLLRRLIQARPALLLSIFAAVNPNLLVNNRMLLSEPVYYLLLLTAFNLYYSRSFGSKKYLLLGIFSGLVYLTRPEGILLLVVFLIMDFRHLRHLATLISIFLLTVLPYLLLKFAAGHNPFTTNHNYVWIVKSYSDGLESGFLRTYPTVWNFFRGNFFWIIIRIIRETYGNITSLLGKAYLAFLTPLLFFFPAKKFIRFLPLILYAIFNFLIITLTWSIIPEPERSLCLVFLFILPFVGFLPRLVWQKKLWYLLFVLTLCLYLVLDIHRIGWARNVEGFEGDWNPWEKSDFYSWVTAHTSAGSVIASDKPHLVNIFTARPSLLLPDNLIHGNNLSLYTKIFGVKIIAAHDPALVEFLKSHARYITSMDGLEIFSP